MLSSPEWRQNVSIATRFSLPKEEFLLDPCQAGPQVPTIWQTAAKKRWAKISRCYLIPVDEEIAVKEAKFRHEGDWGLGDAIIYATAIRENAKVLTGDRHFRGLARSAYDDDLKRKM